MDATLKERAGLISALYLGAYVGSGIPNFYIGQFAKDVSMQSIAVGFSFWIGATWLLVFAFLFWIRRKPSESEKKRF